ncbi:MAG: COG4315 family predicted lipoprotein [Chloroflexota bacterium]
MARKLVLLAVLSLLAVTSAVSLAQVTLGVGETPELGSFLTDPNGMTLYTFTGDTAGVSNVSGTLAQVWPPLRPLADRALELPSGVGGTLSVITRSDGSPQMAYNGMPLYTFTGDTSPGVVNGQGGAGGRFFVATAQLTGAATATPSGAAAATATPAATVAGATPAVVPTATVTPAAAVAGATPAVVPTAVVRATPAATAVALPSAGSPPDSGSSVALLGGLALALLGLGYLLRGRPVPR